jgi:dienelactone hydrolase
VKSCICKIRNAGNMKSMKLAITLLAASFSASLLVHAAAQDLVVSEFRIPTPSSGRKGLEAVMIRPNDHTPHPLALVTHGTPRDGAEMADMTPLRFLPQAREFARRGWTTVIVMRRGFGDSGGTYAEDGRLCSSFPDFVRPTQEAAKDLRESVAYLDTRPEVDPSRMIAIGVSAGGMAVVGLAADPPPGLIAAISFAGGRGSRRPDFVCNPDDLVRAFGYFGGRDKVPMLWIYSQNDHFFSPVLAQRSFESYRSAGGNATLLMAPPFGDDGHHLFSLDGIPIWAPLVDEFLRRQNAVLRDTLLQIPVPAVGPPGYLSEKGKQDFQEYLLSAPHKAFAASPVSGFGWRSGRRSADEAEKEALKECKNGAPRNAPCVIIMSDDTRTN